jgi:Methyltransferase domain
MTIRGLNLGCGARFHQEWVNLDIYPAGPGVQKWDLHSDLPFPEASFDVVYHSHVLEHFSRADGLRLLQRCHCVLRQGGIIRIAVPDLESIARVYLKALDGCLAGDAVWKNRYDWILLEMYDQATRDVSGGEMLPYARRESIPDREFVIERLGGEFHTMTGSSQQQTSHASVGRLTALRDLISRKLAPFLLGVEGMRARDVGIFRRSGEIHRNMYDRYSLARALLEAGFASPKSVGPAESSIEGWDGFHLDIEPDGRVYKPDSLYMEANRA